MTKVASSEIADILPPGIQVLQLLSKQLGWGALYEVVDTRLGNEVRRVAQLIEPRTSQANWTEGPRRTAAQRPTRSSITGD